MDRRAPHADLEEATIADLGARMARGEPTAQSLVERYLARIDALDRAGPVRRPSRRPDGRHRLAPGAC